MENFISIDMKNRKAFIQERDLRTGQTIIERELPANIEERIFKTLNKDEFEIMLEIEDRLNEEDENFEF